MHAWPFQCPLAEPVARPLHLISYDVRCAKRGRRVFKMLKRRGSHRQLSVFLVRLESPALRQLQADLAAAIDPEQDSVLIVRVGGVTELGQHGPMPGARVVVL